MTLLNRFPGVSPPPSLSLPRSSSLPTPPLGDASERSLTHFIGRSGTPRHEKESPTSDGGPRQNHVVDGPLQRANGDEKGCLDEPFEKPSPSCTLKIERKLKIKPKRDIDAAERWGGERLEAEGWEGERVEEPYSLVAA